MKGHFRGANSVVKLLRIAKVETENLRVDLHDIERARDATLLEIENTLAAADIANSAAEALHERRFNLRKSLNALETAYDGAHAKLSKAETEIAKLESLTAVNMAEMDAFLRNQRTGLGGEGQSLAGLGMVGS